MNATALFAEPNVTDRGAAALRDRGALRVSQPGPLPADPSDSLVPRIRLGDERAFETLFRAHYDALCVFATRYVREAALAEEIVQDLFADLWAKRQTWDVRESVRAYLFAATRHRALNLRKRQAMESDWEQDQVSGQVHVLHPVPETADVALERADLRARLDAALEALPERCRLVMHLRWREQMRYAEIAAVMGISVKGVEIQLARGLAAIRQRFV
jgi:RNA polymerase sigma-70 factor (ECF subfamily)